MSHRFFEGAAHAMLYKKFRPIPPPQLIQRIITFLKEKSTGPLETAVDVGCGSGQSTEVLAPYFAKVIGTDISESMVTEAKEGGTHHNVSYKVCPATQLPVGDNSVQLITVSQAAHWIDLPKFYDEGRRVLGTAGVMAIYGYALPSYEVFSPSPSSAITSHANEVKNKLMQKVWQDFYHVSLRNCWDTQRKQVDNRYSGIVIPYADFLRDDTFDEKSETTVADIGNYIHTWSAYQTYCKNNGEDGGRKIVKQLLDRIMIILGDSTNTEETLVLKRTSYFLLLARKPTVTKN